MTVLIAVIVYLLVFAVIVAVVMDSSPVGYQDEEGFHEGIEPFSMRKRTDSDLKI